MPRRGISGSMIGWIAYAPVDLTSLHERRHRAPASREPALSAEEGPTCRGDTPASGDDLVLTGYVPSHRGAGPSSAARADTKLGIGSSDRPTR